MDITVVNLNRSTPMLNLNWNKKFRMRAVERSLCKR